MSFERLTSLLKGFGEKDLEVDKVFVLKFGCVRLAASDDPTENCRLPVTELENKFGSEDDFKDSNEKEYYDAVVDALRKCPNVFDLKIESDNSLAVHDSFVTRHGTILSGNTFKLRIDLPERLQKYRAEFSPSDKPIEQFNIISTGSIYVAYAQIEDFPVWPIIGHEYRELVHHAIDHSTEFKSPEFGPTPIHPDFYLIFVNTPKDSKPHQLAIYEDDGNIFIVADRRFKETDTIEFIFDDFEFCLREFYFQKMMNNHLLDYYVEIYNLFDDLAQSISDIHQEAWWKFFTRNRNAIGARKCLLKLHRRFVEFETELFDYNKSRNSFINNVKEHRVFRNLDKYFSDTTENEAHFPESMSAAINHCESELEIFGNIQSVMIASLLGAIIGSLLTALITK